MRSAARGTFFVFDEAAQAYERLTLDLSHTLTRKTKLLCNLGQGMRCLIVEPVTLFEYQALPIGQLLEPMRDAAGAGVIHMRIAVSLDHEMFAEYTIIVR